MGSEQTPPSTPTTPSSPTVDSTATPSTGTRKDRRARNAAPRQNDIMFATEIGQGLLEEVRRLQAQMVEKDERIKELELEKAELERMLEALSKQLRTSQESEGSAPQSIVVSCAQWVFAYLLLIII